MVILSLLLIILFIVALVTSIMFQSGIIEGPGFKTKVKTKIKTKITKIKEKEFTYYGLISSIFNVVGFIVFAYSVYISTNYMHLPSTETKNMLFYAYMFLFYISFLVILLYLGYTGQLSNRKPYIIYNSAFLLTLIPFIIMRDQLYSEEVFYAYVEDIDVADFLKPIDEGGAVDNIIYKEGGSGDYRDDKNGEKVTGEALEIRKRAAESEYNERSDVDSGVYA